MTDLKYNFIINFPDSEMEKYLNADVSRDIGIFSRYDLEWCLQAYLILKKRNNLSVICTNRLMNNAVNIIHASQLLEVKGNPSQFIVCIQADFQHTLWAHYHIVQNKANNYSNSSCVPLWLQPGLIKRDASRQGVKRVAYAGQIYNGNLAGSEEMWTKLFKQHDIEFTTLPSGACNDLREIDVLIGIRSFDANPYDKKPPSKLINAWHANIPFIGGYDSAYKQVGEVGKDYLIAKSPQETLAAVLKLRDDPQLYNKLVTNGAKKAPLYTEETIAKSWEDILSGPVLNRYNQWLSRPKIESYRFNALLNVGLAQQQTKRLVKKILKVR